MQIGLLLLFECQFKTAISVKVPAENFDLFLQVVNLEGRYRRVRQNFVWAVKNWNVATGECIKTLSGHMNFEEILKSASKL